jgi:signal transduction histidine kinase
MNNTISETVTDREVILRLEKENRHLKRSLEELSVLNELAAEIGGLGSTESILAKIVQHSITAVGAEQGVITLIDDSSMSRKKTAVRMVDTSSKRKAYHLHQSLLIWMHRNKKPLLMNDFKNDPMIHDIQFDESIRSLLCAPLIVRGSIIGVLAVYNKHDPIGFNPDDQRLLSIVAGQSAQVIENARLSEREQEFQHDFSRRMIVSQEQERKRIAAELHDSVGQNLLVIKNRAYLAMESCPQDHPAMKQLQSISDASMQSIDEVREISYNLHPYKLERLGLTKAIQAITARMNESTAVKFSTEINAIDNLFAKDAEIHIYRIVQEGISNAVRHAKPSKVLLKISREPAGIKILITDDGSGFKADEILQNTNEEQGFGLRGMSERVRICGGKFSITSAPEQGTTLSISIPYERKNNEE